MIAHINEQKQTKPMQHTIHTEMSRNWTFFWRITFDACPQRHTLIEPIYFKQSKLHFFNIDVDVELHKFMHNTKLHHVGLIIHYSFLVFFFVPFNHIKRRKMKIPGSSLTFLWIQSISLYLSLTVCALPAY